MDRGSWIADRGPWTVDRGLGRRDKDKVRVQDMVLDRDRFRYFVHFLII